MLRAMFADPVRGVQTDLELDNIGDAETAEVIPHLLADYNADCNDWTAIASEYWKQGRMDKAEELIRHGLDCTWTGRHSSRSKLISVFSGAKERGMDHQALLYLHTMLAHLQLALARTAPKLSVPYASERLGRNQSLS